MSSHKTSLKLISSFLLITMLTWVVGLVGIYYLHQIDAADTVLYENNTVPISQIAEVATAFQRTRVTLRDLILAQAPAEAAQYAETLSQLASEIKNTSAEYSKLIVSKEILALYNTYTSDYAAFITYRNQIISLALAGKNTEALALLRGDAFASAKAVEAGLAAMQVLNMEQARATTENNTATARQATTILLSILFITQLLGISLIILLSKDIARALSMVSHAAQAASSGFPPPE